MAPLWLIEFFKKYELKSGTVTLLLLLAEIVSSARFVQAAGASPLNTAAECCILPLNVLKHNLRAPLSRRAATLNSQSLTL